VKVIREIAEALAQVDTDRRVRESLEEDLIELQTQRGILVRTQDSLYAELKTYKTELRHAQGKLQSLYRAAGRMREALADYTKNIALSDSERITDLGNGA
jgi:chromosome segregation ATPase